jgi:aldehyde dehydrogenase (NAD+)
VRFWGFDHTNSQKLELMYSIASEITGIKPLVELQKSFYINGFIPNLEDRIQTLRKLRNLVKAHEKEIETALYNDLGKYQEEAFLTEIVYTYNDIDFAIKNLPNWIKPKKVKTSLLNQPGRSHIHWEPFGCVVVVSPWNYPILLSLAPAIAAIAAGNRVIIKPSEISVHSGRLLADMINSNFDKSILHVVSGDKSATEQLIDSRPDKLFFTGSPEVGSIVMQRAAKYLIPVTLELGGKTPCIIDKETDIKTAARRIVWGKLINAGQTCVAPDLTYVHKEVSQEFQSAVLETLKVMYPDKTYDGNFGKIVDIKHFHRIIKMIEGTVIYGGNYDEDKLFIEPTIIVNPNENSQIFKEEIFGPLMPIIEYSDIDLLLIDLRKRPKSLSLYIFSNNDTFVNKIVSSISTGNICVNDTMLQLGSNHLPFGGVGNSGMGNYRGEHGFQCFSHEKSVLHKKIWPDIKLRYLPHIKGIKRLEKWLLLAARI